MDLPFDSNSCPICFIPIENQQTAILLPDCQHLFCSDCFTQYLNTEIHTLRALKIKCPQEGCTHTLHLDFIQKLVSPEIFQVYQKRIIDKIQVRTSGGKYRFCPQSGCSKSLNIAPNTKSTYCACNSRICNDCGDFWHEGKTCFEALDPDFEAYIESNNIRCCFMCKTKMARVEGCTHITCPICDYEWCWLCGQEHHQYHPKVCSRTWSPNLPDAIVQQERINNHEESFVKRISMFTLFLLLEQAFWPFFQKSIKGPLTSPNSSLDTKTERFLIGFFTNAIYLAALIFAKLMIWQFPETTRTFQVIFTIILLVPWFVRAFLYYKDIQEQKKRWRSRDFKTFGYTTSSRPGQQNGQNNNDHHVLVDMENFKDYDEYYETDQDLEPSPF